MKNDVLDPKDYLEPTCPFCASMYDSVPPITRIPIERVFDRLDVYLNKNDYVSAERHLLYWLNEARINGDSCGQLAVTNELMGLTRKLAREQDSLTYADSAVSLLTDADLLNSVTAGTTYINVATVYKAFGNPNVAIRFYERALLIYNSYLRDDDVRFAGLYNNLALALKDIGKYGKAKEYYDKALLVNSFNPGTKPDDAITYLNLADLYEEEHGANCPQIAECLLKAKELLDPRTSVLDGYYAFVAEKCAPSFRHFGDSDFAAVLESESARIYSRNAL